MYKKYLFSILIILLTLSSCSQIKDTRPLLTSLNMNQFAPYGGPVDFEHYIEPSCILEHPEVNTDPANKFIDYRYMEDELTFKIPYNVKWGPERFRISPLDHEKTSQYTYDHNVYFGPMIDKKADQKDICEGWTRAFILLVDADAFTYEKYIEMYKNEVPKPTFTAIKNNNDIPIIHKKVESYGVTLNSYIILGKNHTYTFVAHYPFDEIMNSIRFL